MKLSMKTIIFLYLLLVFLITLPILYIFYKEKVSGTSFDIMKKSNVVQNKKNKISNASRREQMMQSIKKEFNK